jgi:hypothetical protein
VKCHEFTTAVLFSLQKCTKTNPGVVLIRRDRYRENGGEPSLDLFLAVEGHAEEEYSAQEEGKAENDSGKFHPIPGNLINLLCYGLHRLGVGAHKRQFKGFCKLTQLLHSLCKLTFVCHFTLSLSVGVILDTFSLHTFLRCTNLVA